MSELDEDPDTKRLAMQMLETEGGGTATMEALVNRTAMIRQKVPDWTISKELTSGFYGPINKGKAQRTPISLDAAQRYQQIFDDVASGSNVIQGRTDQGWKGDPNASGPGRVEVPGNDDIYNYWTGKRGGHEFSHADSARFAENILAAGPKFVDIGSESAKEAVVKGRAPAIKPPEDHYVEVVRKAERAHPLTAEQFLDEPVDQKAAEQFLDSPYWVEGGEIKFEPGKYRLGLKAAKADGIIDDKSYEAKWNEAKKIDRAVYERKMLEIQAGEHPAAKAALHGFGKGSAMAFGGLAGGAAGGLVAPAAGLAAPFVPIVTGVAGMFAGGAAYDLAYKKLADWNENYAESLKASELRPEWNAAGEMAALAMPLPSSAINMAKAVKTVASAKGAIEATKFAGKAVATGAAAGATADVVTKDIEQSFDPNAPGPTLKSVAEGAAIGTLFSGLFIRGKRYSLKDLYDISEKQAAGKKISAEENEAISMAARAGEQAAAEGTVKGVTVEQASEMGRPVVTRPTVEVEPTRTPLPAQGSPPEATQLQMLRDELAATQDPAKREILWNNIQAITSRPPGGSPPESFAPAAVVPPPAPVIPTSPPVIPASPPVIPASPPVIPASAPVIPPVPPPMAAVPPAAAAQEVGSTPPTIAQIPTAAEPGAPPTSPPIQSRPSYPEEINSTFIAPQGGQTLHGLTNDAFRSGAQGNQTNLKSMIAAYPSLQNELQQAYGMGARAQRESGVAGQAQPMKPPQYQGEKWAEPPAPDVAPKPPPQQVAEIHTYDIDKGEMIKVKVPATEELVKTLRKQEVTYRRLIDCLTKRIKYDISD
jgi:hypothetical protein